MEYVYLGIQKQVRDQIRSLKGQTSYSNYLKYLMAAKEENTAVMCSPTDYSIRLDKIEQLMVKLGLMSSEEIDTRTPEE